MAQHHHRWDHGEEGGWSRAGWAYGVLAVAVGIGIFTSGGGLQWVQGVLAVVAGLGMLVVAPGVRLPWGWWMVAVGAVGLAAVPFLPREWGYDPEWRRQVEALGVVTGERVTAHPEVTFQHWVRLALTMAIGMWVLGHRLSDRGHARLLMGLAWVVGVYAVISLVRDGREAPWEWDAGASFGLYANRSHTATLLVIGVLAALTTAVHHIRRGHGGRAGLATLPGLVSGGALLGYSVSRAGILLLGLGLLACGLGLIRRPWSRRTALTVGLVTAVVAALFWFSAAEIKARLLRPVPVAAEAAAGALPVSSEPERELDLGLVDDGRWVVFRDTLDLLRDAWTTGVGHGMFEYVIPQYRRLSASEYRCLHPESDWLLLACEAGVCCALAVAGLVVAVVVTSIRSARGHHGWSLRWGGLVTALVVPVHGIFDTPGQLPMLVLLTALLAAATLRPPRHDTRPAGAVGWFGLRVVGLVAVLAGAWLFREEFHGRPTPAVAAPHAIRLATLMFQEDQRLVQEAAAEAAAAAKAAKAAKATGEAAEAPDAAGGAVTSSEESGEVSDEAAEPDLLEEALRVVEDGLQTTPLDGYLLYLRGMLALQFEGMEPVVEQSFALQRELEPMPAGVALRQADGWRSVDPSRVPALWAEARRRAEVTAQVSKWPNPGVAYVDPTMLAQASTSDALMAEALPFFRDTPERRLAWTTRAPVATRDRLMPELLRDAATAEERQALLGVWKKRGSRAAAEAYEQAP